jgi:glycosyltransferase involved in cell wall biosynthesis
MKKLKILFISRSYPNQNNPVKGVFVREQAKAISLYGDVAVITDQRVISPGNRLFKVHEERDGEVSVMRLQYRKLPIPKISYFIYCIGVFCAFRKALRKGFFPDIIHAHFYEAGVLAVLIGKIYKIPTVITEHYSGFFLKTVRRLGKQKARFALNKADLIITVSKALKNSIQDYGIKNRFTVVPNVVKTDLFYLKTKKKKDTCKNILLVALLKPIKGIPYLLKSLSNLAKERTDFSIDIIGDGPKKEEYEKLAFTLGINNKVAFHGIKTKEEIARFMQNADFFVLPSIWEGLPCVLIESMASGLPIVATNVGGIPEIINKKTGVLVPPSNVKALSKAIDYMLDHYKEYSNREIALYAKNRFSYEMIAKALFNIYKSLLKEKGKASN